MTSSSSSSSKNNLKLNFLFLITIFRLDMISKITMAKPQEEQVVNENVLVLDESISTTAVYLDETSLSTYSATSTDENSLNNGLNNLSNDNLNNDRNRKSDNNLNSNDQQNHESNDQHRSTLAPNYFLNHSTTLSPRLLNEWTTRRPLNRDEWLAKEYFSYLCASENCVNEETRNRIQVNCFAKHGQLNQVMIKCLNNKGRCDNYAKNLNCVLNESKKDPMLIPLELHECVDSLITMRSWKCIRREQLIQMH